MLVLVVEGVDDEGKSCKVFRVVIHQAQSDDVVDAEFAELEPRKQVALVVFFLGSRRVFRVVVRHVVGKTRTERCAEEEVLGEDPVVGVAEVDVVVVVDDGVEQQRLVDVWAQLG